MASNMELVKDDLQKQNKAMVGLDRHEKKYAIELMTELMTGVPVELSSCDPATDCVLNNLLPLGIWIDPKTYKDYDFGCNLYQKLYNGPDNGHDPIYAIIWD